MTDVEEMKSSNIKKFTDKTNLKNQIFSDELSAVKNQ